MDSHYEAIKDKKKYYVISDIHGDLSLFVKFLVGVYNDLSFNKCYIEDKPFHYFNLNNEMIKTIETKKAIIYYCDTFFKIMDKNQGKQIIYETFIKNLNDLLKRYQSCIVLNGDTFNNHFKLNEANQPPFNYLKNFNKYNNKLSYLNQTPTINNELITKLIEISIIYDSIKLLNDNLLFIVGNHELYLLSNDNVNKYAIGNCDRVKKILLQQSICCGNQDIKANTNKTFFNELQDFILNNGYIELVTDQLHIQHAPNINIYLCKDKSIISTTKLIYVLYEFNKNPDIIEILMHKMLDVDNYYVLCNKSIYKNDIYGHTSSEKILRCHTKSENYKTTFFIDRQYSIYEIIKNIKYNYNKLLLEYDIYGQPKLSYETVKEIKDGISEYPIDKIKGKLNNEINIMICGLIYYYCIKHRFILLVDRTETETIINNNIKTCFYICNRLLERKYNIYYQLANDYTTINMYIAQIFSLCYRFNRMYVINKQSDDKPISNTIVTRYTSTRTRYQLFEPINLTYLMCDVTQNDKDMIKQIIF